MVFNMLKPFLTPEVRDGVVFHSGNLATLRSVSFFCETITKMCGDCANSRDETI